ncbi:hypothetical protein OM416_12765 [Paenibacillus sp. LS1]|nr:hypothetical protein [Paenibacillus sp. LS1]
MHKTTGATLFHCCPRLPLLEQSGGCTAQDLEEVRHLQNYRWQGIFVYG